MGGGLWTSLFFAITRRTGVCNRAFGLNHIVDVFDAGTANMTRPVLLELDMTERRANNQTIMGMFQVQVSVANTRSPERFFKDAFWVDTGALYSFAPEDRLKAIGIEPKFTRDFVFADGKKDRRLVGEAAFSVEGSGETITCLVVFGPPGSLLLLGATALENFGVQADPTSQKLRPITAVIGMALAARTGPFSGSLSL
jgi:predicted aspartyl protease